ncbi:MAG: hypothetical protein ACFBSD_08275 [Paracoccaceae bacterium]
MPPEHPPSCTRHHTSDGPRGHATWGESVRPDGPMLVSMLLSLMPGDVALEALIDRVEAPR